MTVDQMRDAVMNARKYTYKNDASTWKNRVKRMTDMQVTAVYLRMKRAGEI